MFECMTIRSIFRDYNVHYVSESSSALKALSDQNAFFIIDARVLDMFGDRIRGAIPGERLLVVEANERNKSLDKCREILETLVEKQVRRNEKLVAIGGGITQDVTAFSASIIYRGIEWAFFPTTLLAQADSCIGSKTSINLDDKKNLIGNFYPPSDIFIDATYLDSLSVADIKSGIGEIMHYYLYAASPLMDELIRDYVLVIEQRGLLGKHIRESLRIKKSVIESDEFDRGERNKFNYGHTFGHALESVTNYAVNHGQAVTIGMDMANYISMRMGIMLPEVFHELHAKLCINFPEFAWEGIDQGRFLDLLAKDKKNVGSNVGCILCEKAGNLIKRQIPRDDQFRNLISAYFSGHPSAAQ